MGGLWTSSQVQCLFWSIVELIVTFMITDNVVGIISLCAKPSGKQVIGRICLPRELSMLFSLAPSEYFAIPLNSANLTTFCVYRINILKWPLVTNQFADFAENSVNGVSKMPSKMSWINWISEWKKRDAHEQHSTHSIHAHRQPHLN